MHQRRKVSQEIGHELPINYKHHAPTTSTRVTTPNRRECDTLSSLIWIFLLSMICVEYIAYTSLDISLAPSSASPIRASTTKNTVDIIQPTPSKTTNTFAPTPHSKGQRLKSAIRDSHKNSYYWKTHTPDPVPPLPSDVDEHGNQLPPVVAYVVTLTKCSRNRASLDGAAVLMHSIRRNSYGWTSMNSDGGEETKWPLYGGKGGRYRYRMYAIVDPEASPEDPSMKGDCARYLQKLGYVILHRPPLVPLFPITSEFYNMSSGNEFFQSYKTSGHVGSHRSTTGPLARAPDEQEERLPLKMSNDGCCGYTETLKLHVYGLIEHPIAVHLDLDSLLLRPMDDLFDAMLGRVDSTILPLAKGPKTKTPDSTKPIDVAFTRDYNQVNHPSPEAQVGYQGGFLAVRPSLDVLSRYKEILKRGEFVLVTKDVQKRGWGGKFGAFYGSLTFQGLVPYYYEEVAPKGLHNEIELDRCLYNQMADNPRKSTYKFPRATPLDAEKMGFRDTKVCRDGRKDCSDTDCQRVHPKNTVTTHFTFCKKPWDCSEGLPGTVADDTCKGLLREWFAVRRELEDWWIMSGKQNGELSYRSDGSLSKVQKQRDEDGLSGHYLGYCKAGGESAGYKRMIEPDVPNNEPE